MRDGIHRTLPIPPSWQRVVKFADRAADRGKRLEDALKNAIFEDFRRFIPKRVRKRLIAAAEAVADVLPNLRSAGIPGSAAEFGGPPNSVIDAALTSLRRELDNGASPNDAVSKATTVACQQDIQNRLRQIEQNLESKESSQNIRPVMDGIRDALGRINFEEEVRSRVHGNEQAARSGKDVVDADEDLRSTNR